MKRFLFFGLMGGMLLVGIFLFQVLSVSDGRLHVVFCSVGQGDAILIRTPGQKYILVDGGPDKRVLDCLSKYMPFWQRELSLVFLSHPHLDHYFGIGFVLERYIIKHFVREHLSNPSGGFKDFMGLLSQKHVPVQTVWQGDSFRLADGVSLRELGPTREFMERTSPGGTIGESGEFASLLTLVTYGDFSLLLTGDSQFGELSEGASFWGKKVDVLQSPHHGSATGVNSQVVQQLSPRLAVISVGKNRYGHPTKQVLDLFAEAGVKVLRTDRQADVEIVSDGKQWWVE